MANQLHTKYAGYYASTSGLPLLGWELRTLLFGIGSKVYPTCVYMCPGHKSNLYLSVPRCNGILPANGALTDVFVWVSICVCICVCVRLSMGEVYDCFGASPPPPLFLSMYM